VQEVGGGKVGSRFAYIFKRQVVQQQQTTKDETDSAQPSATPKQAQGSPKIDWGSRW
jgi:hypothetical protein